MDEFAGQDLVCVRAERTVFVSLSFAIGAGGALKLVGPNGSGKSSLLRVMARLIPPLAGRLGWNGRPLDDDPEAHDARLLYVGHRNAIKPLLTVAENASFWAALRGPAEAPAGAAARNGLAAFGLDGLADIPARMLSSGQLRRLALARLVAAPSRIWLLDEPTVGLDAPSVAALERALADHRGSGGMVALATHLDIEMPDAVTLDLADFAPPQGALESPQGAPEMPQGATESPVGPPAPGQA